MCVCSLVPSIEKLVSPGDEATVCVCVCERTLWFVYYRWVATVAYSAIEFGSNGGLSGLRAILWESHPMGYPPSMMYGLCVTCITVYYASTVKVPLYRLN